jgi:hypothetical protein
MDTDKAAAELKVIRQLMERPIRFSTMSGLSGVWAGAAAILGLALDLYVTDRYQGRLQTALWINAAVWAGVFVLAASGVWALTRRREKKQGMPAWSSVKTRLLLTILAPFACGAGLTAVLVLRCVGQVPGSLAQFNLVPAVWMLFYGAALWQLGEFSPREVRFLGAAFILAGLVSAGFLQDWPYCVLGATFGGFHLVYGAIVWARYGG